MTARRRCRPRRLSIPSGDFEVAEGLRRPTRDLDKLLSQETGLPVIVAEDPLTCVARGGGKALDMMDRHSMDLLSTE